jgi:hypothetical protein
MIGIVTLVASLGCHKAFSTQITQPNPLSQPLETLRESERLTIVTGDMELEMPVQGGGDARTGGSIMQNRRYPLQNTASFTVVSRDRLRFHVQIEHKWQDYAKLTKWNAYLIDDEGRVYLPQEVDFMQPRHVVFMWDYETRTAVRNRFGDVVSINNDGYRRRQTLGSLSLFRGRGDFVFYGRNIFTPDVKAMTLVLEKGGVTFEYTWRFGEGAPVPPGTGTQTAFRARSGAAGGPNSSSRR